MPLESFLLFTVLIISFCTQVWYADDAAAGGSLSALREWWDDLCSSGPMFGYYPNASKSWLVLKDESAALASSIFGDTDINLTTEGHIYLGSDIGSSNVFACFVEKKVSDWVDQIIKLNSIALSQPHAAFSAFTHGLSSKWTCFLRTVPNVENYLQPLEDTIRCQLLPTLIGQCAFTDEFRNLISLPTRLGGLRILNPLSTADSQFNSSLIITVPLVSSIILSSNQSISTILADISQRKADVRKDRRLQLSTLAQELHSVFPSSLQRCLDVAGEKGASTWLTTLPLSIHGFALNKGAFRDALCLRYGWIPVDHCFNCKCGGFPSIDHNEVRDITAHLLTEVCHDVLIEPPLQELSGEALSYRSANRQDQARVDVAASGFWGSSHERAYFDARIYNPFARTYVNSFLSSCYKHNESEKRRN